MRVNGTRVTKPATQVKPGDMLTFVQGNAVRVVEMTAAAARRGPASEAQTLYSDHSPVATKPDPAPARVGPRPTKKARRDLQDLQAGFDDDD